MYSRLNKVKKKRAQSRLEKKSERTGVSIGKSAASAAEAGGEKVAPQPKTTKKRIHHSKLGSLRNHRNRVCSFVLNVLDDAL